MTPAVKVATTHVPKWEKLLEIKVWADACIRRVEDRFLCPSRP